MDGDSLENRVSKIRAKFRCDHRKIDDFTYHHYDKNGIHIEAHLCSQCLPKYTNIIKAYEASLTDEQNDDDGFDNDGMYFKDPE